MVKFHLLFISYIQVFSTLQMEKSDAYRKGTGSSKKWDGGGPGGPGSGPYGGGPGGRPRGLDNVRGIDHSKFSTVLKLLLLLLLFCLNSNFYGNNAGSLPACGSCCGG